MGIPSFHQLPDEDMPTIRPDYLRQAEGGGLSPAPTDDDTETDDQDQTDLGAQEEAAAGEDSAQESSGGSTKSSSGGRAGEQQAAAEPESGEPEGKKKSRFKRPTTKQILKRGLFGLIASGAVAGAGFGIITLSSGEARIITWGEELKSMHMGPARDLSRKRSGQRLLYALVGQTERGRLGKLGNYLADRYEKRLNNDAGLRSIYDRRTGRLVGFEVRDEYKAADFSKDMPELKTTSSADLVDSSGTAVKKGGYRIISMSEDNYRTRSLVGKLALKNIGTSKVGYYIGQRLMITRWGVKFHVLNPIKRKLEESPEDYAKRVQEEEAKSIANESGVGGVDPEAPKTSEARSKFAEIKGQLQEIVKTAKGPLMIIGAICGLKAFSQSIDAQDLANVQTAVRMGMQSVNIASQVQSSKSFTSEQLGVYAAALYDPTTKTSVNDDPGVQYEQGKKPTGFDYTKDMRPTGDNQKPWFFQVVDNIPTNVADFLPGGFVMSSVGGNELPFTDLCSILGNVTKFVGNLPLINIIMGAFQKLIDVALQGVTGAFGKPMTTKDLMQAGIDYFTTKAIDIAARGATKGGIDNMGVRRAMNDQMMAMGGRDLSVGEATQVKQTVMAEQKQEFASASFYDRYLNIHVPNSAVASIVMAWPTSRAQLFATIQNLPSQMASMLSQSFGLGKAFAAGGTPTYDYGFKLIGFSEAELDDPAYANPFANEKAIKDSGQLQQLNQQYGQPCFNMTVDDDGTLHTGASPDPDKRPSNCNDTSNAQLTRYRFYLADMVNANQDACYEDMQDACDQVGFGNPTNSQNTTSSDPTAITDPFAPSDTMTCSVGTDGGVQDGYHNGTLVKIRICVVQGIQVNARIANNLNALLNDAKAAGINLVNGSGGFRTMQGQIDARKRNNCPDIYTAPASSCSPPTAIPGYSNHQMGEAVDFDQNGSLLSSSMSGFAWLQANASKYGLKNLPSENWHWSVDGN